MAWPPAPAAAVVADGGCDCSPQCKNYKAWSREIAAIKVEPGDAVTDSGEAYFLMRSRGIALPRQRPDAATLLVELGTTCFRLSQFQHGEITPEYRDEAVHAMQAYMSRYAGEASRS